MGVRQLSRRWRVVLVLWTVLLLVAPAMTAWLLHRYPGYSPGRFPTGTVASGYLIAVGTALLVMLSPFLAWSFGQTVQAAEPTFGGRFRGLVRAWWRTWRVSWWFVAGLVLAVVLCAALGGLTVARVVVGSGLVLLALGAVLAMHVAIWVVLSRRWLAVTGSVVVTVLLIVGPVVLVMADELWMTQQGMDCDGNGLPDEGPETQGCDEVMFDSAPFGSVSRNAVQTWWLATAAPVWVVADATPKVPVWRPRTSSVPLSNGLDPVYVISGIGRFYRADDEVTTWEPSAGTFGAFIYDEEDATWPVGLPVLVLSGLGSLLLAALVPRKASPSTSAPRSDPVVTGGGRL